MTNKKNRPSWQYDQITTGEMTVSDASKAVQSCFRLFLFATAQKICRLKDKSARTAAIDKFPPLLANEIKNEVMRLWSSKLY